MKYAMFVSVNRQYIPYLNALLNSIEKRKITNRVKFDVFVVHDGTVPGEYIDACKKFSFNVSFVLMDVDIIGLNPQWNSSWKCKASRYYYILEIGREYDACCLMDADLFIVSNQFGDFFKLVDGTENIIGCNERIKWHISDIYTLNGEPILDRTMRLHKFHCNVPLFLDCKKWEDVINDYLRIIYRGIEKRDGQEKTIGDLYSWNIAIYRQKREDDVILMGMPTMTQVHRTGYRDNNCAFSVDSNDYWMTGDGDPVYCIHGRPDKSGFRNIESKNEFAKHNINSSTFKKYARIVEKEWMDLNFNHVVDIREFQENGYWEQML